MRSAGRQIGPVRLKALGSVTALLILPCNAAACLGDYFQAQAYRASGWNTWREADELFRDLRLDGRIAFGAVDSSVLETAPADPRGAIVLETEMDRARNPEGEDWGAPCWRWFRPTRTGKWKALSALTDALMRGVRRVEGLGVPRVLALVNPRAYFLALAAAVESCGVLDRWVLFRVPAHPRYLLPAVREIAPFVRGAVAGSQLLGGLYAVPFFLSPMEHEATAYRHAVPAPWAFAADLPNRAHADRQWALLQASTRCKSCPNSASERDKS